MKLNFIPARDGYHFINTFVNHPVGGTPIKTYGLCGGMVMSALDYWRSGMPIPTHRAEDFGPEGVPAEGSRMRTYIYDRQRRIRRSWPCSCPYSPNCPVNEFCEVGIVPVLAQLR